jgi:hypothetical protein
MENVQNIPGYYNYYFSEDKKWCTVIAEGEVDFDQSIELMDDVVNDPDFSRDMLLLIDLRLIQYHPDYNEFLSIKNHLSLLKARLNNKIALVCSHKMNILAYLICALMNVENVDMKTFISLDEAEKWLKIETRVGKY